MLINKIGILGERYLPEHTTQKLREIFPIGPLKSGGQLKRYVTKKGKVTVIEDSGQIATLATKGIRVEFNLVNGRLSQVEKPRFQSLAIMDKKIGAFVDYLAGNINDEKVVKKSCFNLHGVLVTIKRKSFRNAINLILHQRLK